MQESGDNILILFIVSSLLIVAIVILAFAFLQSYQKKMVAQRLEIEQGKVELKEQLLQATIDTQEKERKRIATDLHDDIGSLLSAIKLNLKHLKTVKEIGDKEMRFLDTTTEMLDNGLSNVRSISYDLLPPTLVRFGLKEALQELANRIKHSEQISVLCDFEALTNCEFDEKSELSIFRVIQELFANTLHHSEATEISMACKKTERMEIVYSDNGAGITHQSQLQGLGMINMQSRIQSIAGSLDISSESGSFQALISIPQK